MPIRHCFQALGCHDCRLADRFGSNAHFRKQEGLQQLVQTLLAQSNDSDTLELQHRLLCMLWYLARKPMESKWSSGAAAAALTSSQGEPGAWQTASGQAALQRVGGRATGQVFEAEVLSG